MRRLHQSASQLSRDGGLRNGAGDQIDGGIDARHVAQRPRHDEPRPQRHRLALGLEVDERGSVDGDKAGQVRDAEVVSDVPGPAWDADKPPGRRRGRDYQSTAAPRPRFAATRSRAVNACFACSIASSMDCPHPSRVAIAVDK